jgi:hypothetical protein
MSSQPPLKRNGGTVSIGMVGEKAFQFVLPAGVSSSSGFVKLLVSTQYLDLDWIQQTSPFHAVFEGMDRVEMTPESLRDVLRWDAFNVLLTMTAGEQGELVAPTYVLATNF